MATSLLFTSSCIRIYFSPSGNLLISTFPGFWPSSFATFSARLVDAEPASIIIGETEARVWKSGLSPLDRWGLISDAKAFLLSGRTSFKEYIKLVEKYQNEEEYLPAVEVSDQLSFLYQIAPSKLIETSRKFHSAGLKIFETKKDDNSTTLKGIIAARLTLLDDAYAKKAGSKLNDLANVEPDMKRSVVMGYARSSNDYDGLIGRYMKSTTEGEALVF